MVLPPVRPPERMVPRTHPLRGEPTRLGQTPRGRACVQQGGMAVIREAILSNLHVATLSMIGLCLNPEWHGVGGKEA